MFQSTVTKQSGMEDRRAIRGECQNECRLVRLQAIQQSFRFVFVQRPCCNLPRVVDGFLDCAEHGTFLDWSDG